MTTVVNMSAIRELHARYDEEKAEARACGNFDFPHFAEWLDPSLLRTRAEERVQRMYDEDTVDLY